MLTKRIIPVLLLKDGYLIRSQCFQFHQYIGNPYIQLERYNQWNLDELIYIDISSTPTPKSIEVLKYIANQCFMPLTFGGGIKTLNDIEQRLNLGADKVTVNSQAILEPELITQAAKEFGQQAIIVSIDIKKQNETYKVYSHANKQNTDLCPLAWAREVQERGAGEIFIQSVERDGTGIGYDLKIINNIVDLTTIPIIACSGAKNIDDLACALTQTKVSAVAAANIFLFKELSYYQIKKSLQNKNLPIRSPEIFDFQIG